MKTVVLMRARAVGSTGADLKAFAVGAAGGAEGDQREQGAYAKHRHHAQRRPPVRHRKQVRRTDDGQAKEPGDRLPQYCVSREAAGYGRMHVPEERPT